MKKIEEKIYLKSFKSSDIENSNYLKWLKDYDVIKYLYRQELFLKFKNKDIYEYVKKIEKSKIDFFYLIKLNKEYIGTVKIGHIDWHARTGDLGIMIGDKNYWNKGYATKVIKLVCKLSKKKFNLRKLIAGTPSINKGMIKAFKKNKFIIEGNRKKQLLISKKYVDHIFLGKFI